MRWLVLCLPLAVIACDRGTSTTAPDPDLNPEAPPKDPVAEVPDEEPAEPTDPRSVHQRKCERDRDLEACTALAVMWERGREGPKDEGRARFYYEKACGGWDHLACFNLARMLEQGRGGDKDEAKAREHYEAACEADFRESTDACLAAGAMHEQGRGTSVDKAKARELYDAACGGGNLRGCHALALALQKGGGAKADKKRARELSQKACDGGVREACAAVGRKADWVTTLQELAEKMCACTDTDCTNKVMEEHGAWAKTNPGRERTEDQADRAAKAAEKMANCISRLARDG